MSKETRSKIIIIMGSKADLEHCKKIVDVLKKFDVEFEMRIASAHKVPLKVLRILEKNEEQNNVVYITVAGRSNALSGFVDANTVHPVIACPPYSEKFGGMDILSTLRMPSGVAPMTVLEPDAAAISALKIIAQTDHELKNKISKFQNDLKNELENEDKKLNP